MSAPMTAYNSLPQPGPSSQRTSARTAKSSRRTRGSAGPSVLLGGGAGVLGSATDGDGKNEIRAVSQAGNSQDAGLQPYHASPFHSSAAPSPTSPLFPVQFRDKSPVSPHFPGMYRAPSPAAPSQPAQPSHMAYPAYAAHSAHSTQSSQSSSRSHGSQSSRPLQSSRPSGSQASLATTASTSSRTLKTPHAKLDYSQPQPTIASSSTLSSHGDYNDSPTPAMPLKDRDARSELAAREARDTRSPTPTQRSVTTRKAPTAPVMSQGPLPAPPNFIMPLQAVATKPASHPFMTASSPPRPTGRTKGPPVPLNIRRKESSLSQDWVQVPHDVQDEYSVKKRSPISPAMNIPPVNENEARSTRQVKKGGQEPMLVPMKLESPLRPGFERASTAPPMSPMAPSDMAQRQGRGSLDRLRSVSPNPPRPRQTSMSTPPAAVLEAAQSQSTGSRLNIFRTGTVKTPPQLRTRKSADVLRPSMDTLRAAGSMAATGISKNPKDARSTSKEQQRALGVAHGATPTHPAADSERKSSGLSLKKSSGALKALFNRGASGKGKERADTPPLPNLAQLEKEREKTGKRRPSTAPKDDAPKVFGKRPVNPSEWSVINDNEVQEVSLEQEPGRRSLASDRARYPVHPNLRPPPSLRAASYGPSDYAPGTAGARLRLPSRDLPPLPPPSPVGEQAQASAPSQGSLPARTGHSEQIEEGKPQRANLGETPPSSSLPYLSPLRASFLLESQGPEGAKLESAATTPATSVTASPGPNAMSTSSSNSETMGTPTASFLDEPLKISKSLHLLQLPDLDLDFSLSFDSIGLSPSTPRRGSPQKARARMSPASPQRSLTMRHSPRPSPKVMRANSERRRSQSVDAHQSPILWGLDSSSLESPEISKLFASSSTSSVPGLSKPFEPTASDDSHQSQETEAAQSRTASSPHSNQSLPSRDRSSSNVSSTKDTSSPSPPMTPEDVKANVFPDLPLLPTQAKMLNPPPSIPLPALPPAAPAPVTPPSQISSALALPSIAPAATIQEVTRVEEKKVIRTARVSKPVLHSRSVAVIPDVSRTTVALARDMERALHSFRGTSPSTASADRANVVRNQLVPLIAEIDKRTYEIEEHSCKMLREQSFQWIDALLSELKVEQAANERGASLEGLAGVLETACLSEQGLRGDPAHQVRFSEAMMKCMKFVMSKLGAKGVFHNTLLFSGRFLAFAFFRVPYIGKQLVEVLQPPRGALMRFTRSALVGETKPPGLEVSYPKHLMPLCLDNSKSYSARLADLVPNWKSEQERDAFQFVSGNWLRRWQSDDSELFPAFYRAYHRQLATYLAPVIEHYETLNQPLPASVLLRAPGYAHLATIFAKKCHSYILGSVNAVTTSSSSQNFDATESAGFRGSQKPAVLETANRRLVETMQSFANLRVKIPTSKGVRECDGQQLYSGMLDLWTKNLIGKTSLYAPKGVFCLFDLLDGIVDPPMDFVTGERRLAESSLLDVPHLIHVIRMVLTEGEHALTLVKVVAFVFTHWEVLTARHEDRKELCLELLLEKDLFERLLLFWSQSVRSYVLRLVVFRLGHLHTKREDGIAHDVEIESVRVLQTRLERIKRRHDELEPKDLFEVEEEKEEPYLTPYDGGSMPRSRSTITMVSDSPRAASNNKAERLLGLGFGDVQKGGVEVEEQPNKVVGKATNWLKKSFGTKKKKSTLMGTSPIFGTSPTLAPGPLAPATSSVGAALGPAFGSSPTPAESSTETPLGSYTKQAPELSSSKDVPRSLSPVMDSPASSSGSSSPTSSGENLARKGRPPQITTSESSPIASANEVKSPNTFAFEFELPTMSPRSDTFDPTPLAGPVSPRRSSQPPSPRAPSSPHMSKSFSKRASLLPPSTATILAESPSAKRVVRGEEAEKGYEVKLHAYAIRMLAELEDAQKEYDEWWSEGGIGRMDGAPPRLTVAWPFHEGED